METIRSQTWILLESVLELFEPCFKAMDLVNSSIVIKVEYSTNEKKTMDFAVLFRNNYGTFLIGDLWQSSIRTPKVDYIVHVALFN